MSTLQEKLEQLIDEKYELFFYKENHRGKKHDVYYIIEKETRLKMVEVSVLQEKEITFELDVEDDQLFSKKELKKKVKEWIQEQPQYRIRAMYDEANIYGVSETLLRLPIEHLEFSYDTYLFLKNEKCYDLKAVYDFSRNMHKKGTVPSTVAKEIQAKLEEFE